MDTTEVDVQALFGLLARQLRLIIISVATVLALAVIALLLMTPIYSATALILVDPSHKNLLEPDQLPASAVGDSARVDSEVEILRSDSILLRVIEAENLLADDEFGASSGGLGRFLPVFRPQADGEINGTLERLRNAVSAQRRGLTYVIAVGVGSRDPEKSARLANALTGAYIAEQLASKVKLVQTSRDILQARIEAARQSMLGVANAQLAYNQYETLLTRAQDLEAQADLQLADSRIVSPALAPQDPAFPNRSLILLLALILGLALGVALAFLYENLIGGFTSEEQTEAVLKTGVAASVPREKPGSSAASLSDLMVSAPLSVFAETVRRIRLAIDRPGRPTETSGETRGKVIMVSSSSPGDGKTTIAMALARSFALSGQRTLLIDCDLRKPSVHRHLGLSPSEGLQEYLTSTPDSAASIASIVSRDPLTDLTVLVGAHRSDTPTDQLLSSQPFGRLIEASAFTFDIVILDTPPLGPVVDGLYIAPYADAILFIARWANTAQLDAKRAIASLGAVKQPTTEIITVLNRQAASRSSYQRKYAGYYAKAH